MNEIIIEAQKISGKKRKYKVKAIKGYIMLKLDDFRN